MCYFVVMAVFDNVLGILRQWDLWKRIEAAPDEIDALEERVAELEKRLQRMPGEACPSCGALAMRLHTKGRMMGGSINPHRTDRWKCQECEFEDQRFLRF